MRVMSDFTTGAVPATAAMGATPANPGAAERTYSNAMNQIALSGAFFF
jgi:hypothetical protein